MKVARYSGRRYRVVTFHSRAVESKRAGSDEANRLKAIREIYRARWRCRRAQRRALDTRRRGSRAGDGVTATINTNRLTVYRVSRRNRKIRMNPASRQVHAVIKHRGRGAIV